MRLKSRTRWPPRGFQLLIPEIGMKEPTVGSFTEVVDAFSKIVQKNPTLAQKQGWPTNREDQENWIDERESRRMVAHQWFEFVDLEAESPPVSAGGSRRNIGGANVAAANTALTGLAIYRELFSHGAQPIARAEAERRASVCAECPLNKRGGLREFFVESIARGITELYGVLRDLDLTTSHDKDLGTCTACSCPTRAKVQVPIDIIERHMKPDVRINLDAHCWILTETQQAGITGNVK